MTREYVISILGNVIGDGETVTDEGNVNWLIMYFWNVAEVMRVIRFFDVFAAVVFEKFRFKSFSGSRLEELSDFFVGGRDD